MRPELPFTREQFFAVFGEYNDAVWPAQTVLSALALAALVLIFVRWTWSEAAVAVVLAFL